VLFLAFSAMVPQQQTYEGKLLFISALCPLCKFMGSGSLLSGMGIELSLGLVHSIDTSTLLLSTFHASHRFDM